MFKIIPNVGNALPNTKRDNEMVIWLGMGVFLWMILRIWQGLDFKDMGLWLTGYQQFYSYPKGIDGGLLNWLTFFIGHWVGALFGEAVLSYKLGYAMVVAFSAVIAYLALENEFGPNRTLGFLVFLTAIFIGRAQGNWIGYNNLTALFYTGGGALLYFGLVLDRKLLVILASAILGANIFVRFPNLLGIALISAVWLHAYVCGWSWRTALAWSAMFLCGFLGGMALIWSVIALHGHETFYVHGLTAIFDMALDGDSHHSGRKLIRLLIADYTLSLAYALPIIAVLLLLSNWVAKQHKYLTVALICFLAYLLFHVLDYGGKWVVTGLCNILLLMTVIRELRNNPSLALLAFVAGLVLCLAPLGSNNGIANSVYGMWIALPLVLMRLQQEGLAFGRLSSSVREGQVVLSILVLAIFVQAVFSAWRFTSRDSEHRLGMTSSISHPRLIGTFTTVERAEVVESLLDGMKRFVKPGDELLAYNDIEMVHFLTETRPWLGTPAPMLLSPKKIEHLLRQKESSHAKLPYIVRATGSTLGTAWPVLSPLSDWNGRAEGRRVFADFEQRHGYILVWANSFFEILQPPSNNR